MRVRLPATDPDTDLDGTGGDPGWMGLGGIPLRPPPDCHQVNTCYRLCPYLRESSLAQVCLLSAPR